MIARVQGLRWLVACASMIVATSAHAQEIDLSGVINVEYSTSTARLQVGQVENQRPGGRSGTLSLVLFFNQCATPEGCLGFDGARFRLGELDGGQRFFDIDSGTIAFTPPPPGTYTMHLAVTEFPNDRVYLDSFTFAQPQVFIAPGGGTSGGSSGGTTGGTTGGGGQGTLTMSSPASFNVVGDRVTMQVASVCNTTSVSSENLSIRFWYTVQQDAVGPGFNTATLNLGRLPSNNCFNNIASTVPFDAPPPGTYFPHFLLLQAPDDGENPVARAILDFPAAVSVGGGGTGAGAGAGGGGGGGGSSGGGAPGVGLLLTMLGFAGWQFRRR